MSQITRQEVLANKRERYARAAKHHKSKIITELVELFGDHRKSVIRALRSRSVIQVPFVLGRPKDYDPDKLLPSLKPICAAHAGYNPAACGSKPLCLNGCWPASKTADE